MSADYVVKLEETATPSPTIHLDADGNREYPCHCGKTHRGDYAAYDWAHHNCFHRSPLVLITEEVPGYYMCPSCGEVFWLAEHCPAALEPGDVT